jgi:hypothetical protein
MILTAPVHTATARIGPWETLKIDFLPSNSVTIRTMNGYYLTAVNGGGIGGPNTMRRRRFTQMPLNLSALKGEDSQATLRITTLTLAPEGSHRPHL